MLKKDCIKTNDNVKEMYKIGIIILNYIDYKDTIYCVNCFLNQENYDYEIKIIVVDNGSKNESVSEIKRVFADENNVFVEQLPENVGFAKGNNFGYKKICERFNQIPDFVIISNSDIILLDNQLYLWILKEKEKCDFAVLGPDVFSLKHNYHQSPFYEVKDLDFLEREIYSQKRKDYKYGFNNLIKSTKPNHRYLSYSKRHVLHGAFLVFSRLYFNYYNEPFYSKTFLYCEELILKLRCDLKSLIMVYSPEYKVNHLESASTTSAFKNKEEFYKEEKKQRNYSNQIRYKLFKKVSKRSLWSRIRSTVKNQFDSLPWVRGVNKKILDNRKEIENMFDLFSNKLIFEYVPTNSINRLAVYTAIIGNQDDLLNLTNVCDNCDYFCITDNKNITSKLWNIIYFDSHEYEEFVGRDNDKTTLFIKTHPDLFFQNYKHTLWIDSNIDVVGEVASWILLYNKNNSILLFRKEQADLLSEELENCVSLESNEKEIVSKQISKYYNDGYNDSIPIVTTNVIYRENNSAINEVNDQWWNEIKRYPKNDYLSLNYILWKNNIAFDLSNLNPFDNRYFKKIL